MGCCITPLWGCVANTVMLRLSAFSFLNLARILICRPSQSFSLVPRLELANEVIRRGAF